MAEVKNFKMWCQKVLPLVYDDSLSYYEVLCKVVDKLNKTINAVNENTEGFATLQSFVDNYFNNLDVQNEINHKLDAMASDGSLDALIEPYVNAFLEGVATQIDDIESNVNTMDTELSVLTGRVNDLTNLPEGSTTGDAELADIRTAFNGFVYPNAGEAVRVSDTLDNIKSGEFNWFDERHFVRGKYFQHVEGIEYHDSTSSSIFDYGIPIKSGVTYYYRNLYAYFCVVEYSNGTYTFLSDEPQPTNQSGEFTATHDGHVYLTVPANASGTPSNMNLAFAPLGGKNLLKQGTWETFNDRFLDESYIAKDSISDEVLHSNNFNIQYIHDSEFTDQNFYYQIANGVLLIPSNANANTKLIRKPIRIHKNVRYSYVNLFAYFCIFRADDGTLSRLSDNTSPLRTGTFTPTKDGYLFITKSTGEDMEGKHCMFTNGEVPYAYTEGIYNVTKEIHVKKDGGGDFTKLIDGIAEAVKYKGCKLYVHAGTYDILEELGADYVQNNTEGRGPEVYNEIHIIFSPNSKVICEYTGNREWMNSHFSPFNMNKGGATIEGLTLVCKNVRYCIHDERTTNTDMYVNNYIDCNLYIDNTQNPNWTSKQCIGGGLGTNGEINIDGCIFESVGVEANNGTVSYHNSESEDAKSLIVIKNSYFKGSNSTARFGYYGGSNKITDVILTNNSFSAEPVLRAETSQSENVNMQLIEWNNQIRQ